MLKVIQIQMRNATNAQYETFFDAFVGEYASLAGIRFEDAVKSALDTEEGNAALARVRQDLAENSCESRWPGKVFFRNDPRNGTEVVVFESYMSARRVEIHVAEDGTVAQIVADFAKKPSLQAAKPLLSSGLPIEVSWVHVRTSEDTGKMLVAAASRLRRHVRNGEYDAEDAVVAFEWALNRLAWDEWTLTEVSNFAFNLAWNRQFEKNLVPGRKFLVRGIDTLYTVRERHMASENEEYRYVVAVGGAYVRADAICSVEMENGHFMHR